MNALSHLCNDDKVHEDCHNNICYSTFRWEDLTNDGDNKYFYALRKYLYSYLGVKIEKKLLLLIQKGNPNGKSYLLCVFNDNINDNSMQMNICSAFRHSENYIKNIINGEDVSPLTIINNENKYNDYNIKININPLPTNFVGNFVKSFNVNFLM